MKTSIQFIAIGLTVAAMLAWAGVIYAGRYILSEASARASTAVTAEQELDRVAYAQRLKSLAADTQADRDRLHALTHANIVSIVNTIEAASREIGVNAQVNNALPVGQSEILPGGVPLETIVFVVEAQGTFAQLMRAAALFEHLSLPSSVEQLELERSVNAATGAASWRLMARIRVLTTSNVSS